MRSGPLDLARLLERKAANDIAAAEIGLAHGAPLDTGCFHIQQAAEKLLKSALAGRGVEYPFTHELRELLEIASPYVPGLDSFRATLPAYTEFAVRLRYDDLVWADEAEARAALAEVRRLREFLGRA